MNGNIRNNTISILRSLYRDDPSAKAILDYFSTRKKAMSVSSVDRIGFTSKVAYAEVVRVFKELANAGCGQFRNGRKGYKSRMHWDYSLVSLGLVAKGEAAIPEPIDLSSVDEEEDDFADVVIAEAEREDGTLPHAFQLRPDMTLHFGLPADLTAREAERLAAFIRSLPFE
ncbi:UNVERIFIED_ORG: hypothetical protein GGI66_000773 [Rhizobium esperanzae]